MGEGGRADTSFVPAFDPLSMGVVPPRLAAAICYRACLTVCGGDYIVAGVGECCLYFPFLGCSRIAKNVEGNPKLLSPRIALNIPLEIP